MTMVFEVKKTTELSGAEKQQINNLFNKIFEKERSIVEFENQFVNNPLGFAYHSFMKDEGVIVGHNAGIPSYYIVDGRKELFVCNVDTMIEPHHRGIDNFFDLISNATERYAREGAVMLYGFPNDNSYPLLVPMGLMDDIGKLDTYCLPYRVGGIKKKLGFLNPLSKLFFNVWNGGAALFANGNISKFRVEKEAESYDLTRYKRSDGKYTIVNDGSISFVYKIMTYEGVRTAFLIDVKGKSAENFVKAIRYIKKHDSDNFDLLLYVGHLPFKNHGMIRIPRKFEPKHFNFTGLLLSGDKRDLLFNIDNWDVNLSNYDLV